MAEDGIAADVANAGPLGAISRRKKFFGAIVLVFASKVTFIYLGMFTPYYDPVINAFVLTVVAAILVTAAYAAWKYR